MEKRSQRRATIRNVSKHVETRARFPKSVSLSLSFHSRLENREEYLENKSGFDRIYRYRLSFRIREDPRLKRIRFPDGEKGEKRKKKKWK